MWTLLLSLLVLVFVIVILSDLKRGVTMYIFLYPLLPIYLAIDFGPGFPLITVVRLLLAIALGLFVIQLVRRKGLRKVISELYLKREFLLLALTLLVLTLFHLDRPQAVIMYSSIIVEQILLFVLIWSIFDREADVNRVFGAIFVSCLLVTVYGLFVKIIGSNPYLENMIDRTGETVSTFYDSRGGVENRVASTFSHPIAYGGWLAMLLPFIIVRMRLLLVSKRLFLSCLLLLSMANIVFTNSRTPIVSALVGVVVLFMFLGKKNKAVLFASALCLLLFLVLFDGVVRDSSQIVYSAIYFWRDDAALAGSSLELRASLFLKTFAVFSQAPILGNGLAYLRYLVFDTELGTAADFFGESILVQLLIDVGIVGLLVYGFFYFRIFSLLRQLIRRSKSVGLRNYLSAACAAYLSWFVFAIITGDLDTFRFALILLALSMKLFYIRDRAAVGNQLPVRDQQSSPREDLQHG